PPVGRRILDPRQADGEHGRTDGQETDETNQRREGKAHDHPYKEQLAPSSATSAARPAPLGTSGASGGIAWRRTPRRRCEPRGPGPPRGKSPEPRGASEDKTGTTA